MKNKVVINGRFLTMPLSGVQRTAYEMVLAIDSLLENNQIDRALHSYTVIYSGEIINSIALKHITLLKKGWLKGNLWEQLELPLYSRRCMLLSMCSISTLFKSRQIVVIHDASFFINKQFFSAGFRIWYKLAIPLLGKIAAHIITVSEFSKNELNTYGGISKNKVTVIYNAADHILRFGAPSKLFENKINALKPYCLAVSNLAANKNFTRLGEAIKATDFKDFNMLIAGGSMNTLNAAAPTDLSTYLGYVSNEELSYLYKHASLFLFPSLYEGFGIPPLEAMISGCPVLASGTSSLPEVLQDAAAYFNPYSVDDMTVQINALLSNQPKLDQLKLNGYRQAARYSWSKSALQLTQLIDNYNE